nr:MAG TPA: hypothetical protein [Caudoviricetes sp.]
MRAKENTFYFVFSGLDFPFVYWRQARHQNKNLPDVGYIAINR